MSTAIRTSQRKSKSKLLMFVAVLFMALCSLFTFAACKLTNNSSSVINPGYDENGLLRLYSPSLEFYPYSREAYLTSGSQVIGDDSGSFFWPLQYYFTGTDDVNIQYDQVSYLANFFQDSKFDKVFDWRSSFSKVPIYSSDKLEIVKYYYQTSDSVSVTRINDNQYNINGQVINITWEGFVSGEKHFYGLADTAGSNTIRRVYSGTETLFKAFESSGRDLNSTIQFPDYEVVIDGKYYTFKVELNDKNLRDNTGMAFSYYDTAKREMRKNNPFIDMTDNEEGTGGSLFSFSYRVGRNQTGEFIPCPEGMITYFTDSRTGEFMVRLNPMLEGGGTSRYLKVKALTKESVEDRGDSLYSNTISFNAYTMTFEAYSPNSTELTYGGLLYDSDKYYFHTVKRMLDSENNQEYYSMLVGSFPEGRQIVVSRETRRPLGNGVYDNNYDYALQPWTLNAKAENSAIIDHTQPKDLFSLANYKALVGADLSCIPEAMKTGASAFNSVYFNQYLNDSDWETANNYVFMYYQMNVSQPLDAYAREFIYGVDARGNEVKLDDSARTYLRSDLILTSCDRLSGSKLYANHAKVRNFNLSGTVFDSANFFGGGNQYLTGFDIIVYNRNQEVLCSVAYGDNTSYPITIQPDNFVNETNRNMPITIDVDGSQFKVSGLECGDYIAFEKLGTVEGSGFADSIAVPYTFHSAVMKDVDISGNMKKCLTVMENETVYTDRQSVGIIATMIEEESNLVVNIYRTNEDGSTTIYDEKGNATLLQLLQDSGMSYEVIRSVTSVVDDQGYVTTNVIISIQLPANCTLVGYNAETLPSNNLEFYYFDVGLTRHTLVRKQIFDAPSFNFTDSDFFEYTNVGLDASKSGGVVSRTNDGQQLETKVRVNGVLANRIFNYVKTVKNGDHTIMYYNMFNEPSTREYHVIAYDVDTPSKSSLITYTKIDAENFREDEDRRNEGEFYEIYYNSSWHDINRVISNDEVKDGDLAYDNEMKNVSAIATVYQTDMEQRVGLNAQTIYVYYDIVNYGNANYYVSPIGKLSTIKDDAVNDVFTEFSLYFDEITNFDDLLSRNYIMLGSDIITSNNSFAMDFRDAIGAKIIASCYYYIRPLGNPDQVLVSQYTQTESRTEQEEVQQFFYYAYNSSGTLSVLKYSGSVASSIKKDNNNQDLYLSTLALNDANRNMFDASLPVRAGYLYDQTGVVSYHFTSNDITNPANYVNSNTIVSIPGDQGNQYVAINNYVSVRGSDSLFKFSFVLWEMVGRQATQSELCLAKIDGFGNGRQHYYRVLNYIKVGIDADGRYTENERNIVSTVSGAVLDTSRYYDLELLSSTGDNSIGARYTVSKMTENGVDLPVVQNYKEYTTNVLQITAEDRSTYKYYLIPSVEVKNNDNISNLYFGATDQGKSNPVVAFQARPVYQSAYNYLCSTPGRISYENGDETGRQVAYYNGDTSKPLCSLVKSGFRKPSALQDAPSGYGFLLDESGNVVLTPNKEPIYVDLLGNHYDSSKQFVLAVYHITAPVTFFETGLVRSARKMVGNESVTVLGKYFLASGTNEPVIYPSFSALNQYSEDDAYILSANADGIFNYYSLDYTSRNLVVEGMPGFKLLSGAPYPNPVLYFQIRHKLGEDAVVNLSLDIKEAFYVEVLGTSIRPEDTNQVRDFSTYAFKDTLQNLTLNDYINKTYWILDSKTYKSVTAFVKTSEGYDLYLDGAELTIQNVGINEGDPYLYFNDVIGANGKYINLVYREVINERGEIEYRTIKYDEDVILWRTDSTKIENVPTFDIHTYYQGDDGVIYFTSGSAYDDNIICIGLNGLSAGVTMRDNGVFNYDDILISGVTSAFRTKASENIDDDLSLYGYWLDRGLNIMNAYNSHDAYFLTGREMAVLVASPTVVLQDDAGQDYVYRFKEWQVYSRYNSEVLYLNKGIDISQDKENAILRFTTEEAGYYVILPVYERVFSVDLGTAVIDGSLNQGGSIDLYYDADSDEVDVNNRVNRELFLNNFYETEENGKTGYFYGDIDGSLYLYFTGNFTHDDQPIFSHPDNIYSVRYNQDILDGSGQQEVTLYFRLILNSRGKITGIEFLRILNKLEPGRAGIIPVTHAGDVYYFNLGEGKQTLMGDQGDFYLVTNNDRIEAFDTEGNKLEENDESYYLPTNEDGTIKTFHLQDLFNYAFNSYFYYDTLTGDVPAKVSMPLYYDYETREFKSLDLSRLSGYNFARAVKENGVNLWTPTTGVSGNWDFMSIMIYYNWFQNNHIFNGTLAKLLYPAGLLALSAAGLCPSAELLDDFVNKITNLASKISDIFGGVLGDLIDKAVSYYEKPRFILNFGTYTLGANNRVLNWRQTEIDFDSLIKDKVAYSSSLYFTALNKVDNTRFGDQYLSSNGSLADGELFADENGNVYATQQFKSAYIDRDASITLTAVPAAGYRVEGWYKCVYDPEIGAWLTTDEKVENSDYAYTDEILRAHYNSFTDEYYYITPFVTVDNPGTEYEDYRYYRDEEKTIPALVPSNMLSQVRGFFINIGTSSSPNWIQVYRQNQSSQYYYYDKAFTQIVDEDEYEVVEKTFLDAIKTIAPDYYTFNNVRVYKVTETDVLGNQIDRYYRTRQQGNIVVEGNSLIIHTLHSNVRYVAKFVETYNEYIFAEDEESSGINVKAVYYTSNDERKLHDEELVIRTSGSDGRNMTGLHTDQDDNVYGDPQVDALESSLFNLYEDESRVSNFATHSSGKFNMTVNGQTKSYNRYNGASEYTRLLRGFGGKTESFRVDPDTDDELGGRLALKSMFFDCYTTVYIVVSVKADFNLTIHSLGMNSSYEITPILAPTDEFINYNQAAQSNNKVDYYYYIFRVEYNRDPQNEYGSYIVHPDRGNSMAHDVVAGNYLNFYKEIAGFEYYDNNNRPINFTYSYDVNGAQQVNMDAYFRSLRLSENILSQITNKTYRNIEEGLNELNNALKQPGLYTIGYVTYPYNLNNGWEKEKTSVINAEDIFACIRYERQRLEDGEGKHIYQQPYLIWSAYQNFVNLSTIPIYNYTVQSLTVDQFSQNNDGNFKYDENGKAILQNSSNVYHKLKNSFYVAAGTNSRTYVGSGERREVEYEYKQHSGVEGSYVGNTPFMFDTYFYDIDWSDIDNSPEGTLLADLAFAQNTIVLLEGTNSAESGYAFVGWYEQKYDRDTGTWSAMTLMSNELTCPYLSLATADTVVVALYKRVVNVSLTYDANKMTIDFSNDGLANVGTEDPTNSVKKTMNGSICTLEGTFYFDAHLQLTLIPNGGYRFDNITVSVGEEAGHLTKKDLDLHNPNILYYDKDGNYMFDSPLPNVEGQHYTIDDMRLNGVFGIDLPVKEVIGGNDEAKLAQIDISAKKVNLVYIDIENFVRTDGPNAQFEFNGVDFALYDISGLRPESLFETYEGSIQLNALGKDSTQHDLSYVLQDGHLYIYGYFDDELSGNLVLVSRTSDSIPASVFEWYINGCAQNSSDLSETFTGLKTNAYNGEKDSEFVINFEYEGSLADLNSKDYFDLSMANFTYVAKAIVESNQQVIITHSYVDDIADSDKAGLQFEDAHVGSILTYNGKYFSDTTHFDENGQLYVDGTQIYTFGSNAVLQIQAQNQFVEYNGSVYVFIGYYKIEYDYTPGQSQSRFLGGYDSDLVLMPSGVYEAKYAKINKVTINSNGYGRNEIVGTYSSNPNNIQTYGYYDEGNYNYVVAGSTLEVSSYPDEHYILPNVNVSADDGNASYTLSREPSIFMGNDNLNHLYLRTTIGLIKQDITIEINFERGTYVSISQKLYNNIDMANDPQLLTSPYAKMTDDGGTYGLNATLGVGHQVTLGLYENVPYYFIGWYKDGELITNDLTYSFETENDVVYEARFTYYLTINLVSRIYGTDTSISGFKAQISYTDIRDGEKTLMVASSSAQNTLVVPSGALISATELRDPQTEGNPFSFIGWKLNSSANQFRKDLSTEKEASFILSKVDGSVYSGNTYICYLVAAYTYTTTINIAKNIQMSEQDQIDKYYRGGRFTNEFVALFEVTITYTDIYGNSQTMSMLSNLETSLKIKRGTSLSVKVSISNIVSSRYFLSSVSAEIGGQTTYFDNQLSLFDFTDNIETAFSANITLSFTPAAEIVVAKELDGVVDNFDDISLDYTIDESEREQLSGQVESQEKFNVQSGADFSLHTSTTNENYLFVGWYASGKLISREESIDQNDLTLDKNLTIVARYITIVNLSVERTLDGENAKNKDLPVYISGNIIEDSSTNNGIDTSVKLYSLNGDQDTIVALTLLYGGKLVLAADQINGYRFMGYEVYDNQTNITTRLSYENSSVALSTVASLTLNGVTNLRVVAKYEREYAVHYNIFTFNHESGPSENTTIRLNSFDRFYLSSATKINFSMYGSLDYSIDSISVNGVNVNNPTYNMSVDVPSEKGDVVIDIRVMQEAYIDLRIAVNGSNDGVEIKNKLGVSNVNITRNGSNLAFDYTRPLLNTTSSYVGKEYTLSAAETVSSSKGTTYYFNGWYVYDNNSVLTSTYPISYSKDLSISLHDDVSIVAKYEESKPLLSHFETSFKYEFINQSGTTESDVLGGVVENGQLKKDGKTYDFVGYYTRVSTGSTPYIKLSNTYDNSQRFDGLFANVVGRFVEVSDYALSINNASSSSLYIQTSLGYVGSLSSSALGISCDADGLKLSSYFGAKINLSATASNAYQITKSPTSNVTSGQKVTDSLETTKRGILTQVEHGANIKDVTITRSGETYSVELVDKTVKTQATFSITSGTSSQMEVTIYKPSDSALSETFTITAATSRTIELSVGYIVSLSVKVAANEEFVGYTIGGDNYGDIVTTYYLTSEVSALSVVANIKNLYTVVVDEENEAHGNITLSREGQSYAISVRADKNYEVKDVLIASINGEEFVSLINGTEAELSALVSAHTSVRVASAPDSDNKTYAAGYNFTLSLTSDIVIKVTYRHYTEFSFKVRNYDNSSSLDKNYNFYLFEDQSPVTLESLVAFLSSCTYFNFTDVIESEDIDRSAFLYNGSTFESGQEISIENLDYLYIEYTRHKSYQVKVNIVTEVSDNNFYNTPTSGLQITYKDKVVSTFGDSKVFEYYHGTGSGVVASDTLNNFIFVGYFAKGVQLSTSSKYLFNESTIVSGLVNENGTYVLEAHFVEVINHLQITADYNQADFNVVVNGQTLTSSNGQYVGDDSLGNIGLTVEENRGNRVFTLSYPNSYISQNISVKIVASDFTDVNSDDVYLTVAGKDKFYERNNDDSHIRFFAFENDGKQIGELYVNEVDITLSDYKYQSSISAQAKRLYLVEYTYNYYSDAFSISLNIISANGSISVTNIGMVTNKPSLDEAIISYWAEDGMILSAKVTIINQDAIDAAGYVFYGIKGARVSGVLSSKLANKGYILGDNAPITNDGGKTTHDWWQNVLEVDINRFVFATSLLYSNVQIENEIMDEFTFKAMDLSLIADFFDVGISGFKDVVSLLYNPDYDGETTLDFEGNYNSTFSGEGFKFGFISEDVDEVYASTEENDNVTGQYHWSMEDTRLPIPQYASFFSTSFFTPKVVKELIELGLLSPTLDSSRSYGNYWLNFIINKYKFNRSDIIGENLKQLTINMAIDRYVSLSIHAAKSNKQFVGDGTSFQIKDDVLIENVQISLDGSQFDSIKNGNQYTLKNSSSGSVRYPNRNTNYLASGQKVTIKAYMKENYYFLGFILVHTGYQYNLNAMGFGGERYNALSSTYTFIPYTMHITGVDGNEIYDYAEATFTLSDDTEVYALYEARVFIVSFKQYEFDEDAERLYQVDQEGKQIGKMTEKETDSATLKGALVVEANEPFKLSSVSHKFVQFAGWATTEEFNDQIEVVYDSGLGYDNFDELFEQLEDDADNIVTLLYNYIYGLYDSDLGDYTSANTTNNIYFIRGIDRDIDLNAYYSFISYNLIIDLTEILSTYLYQDGQNVSKSSNNSTYLTYADYVRQNPNWRNPSAGTYFYTYWNGSNEDNLTSTSERITISDKDPYVYAITDYNGVLINANSEVGESAIKYDDFSKGAVSPQGIPTRISSDLISISRSQQAGFLVYNSGNPVYIAKGGQTTNTNATVPFPYLQTKTGSVITNNCIEIVEKLCENNPTKRKQLLGSENMEPSLYAFGYSDNQYEYATSTAGNTTNPVLEDGRLKPRLDNIYNFVDIYPGGQPTLKANLFQIKVDGLDQPILYNSNSGELAKYVEIDLNARTIRINLKLMASTYGFPSVQVKMLSDRVTSSVASAYIDTLDYIPTSSTETNYHSKIVKGFYTNAFDDVDFTKPNEFNANVDDIHLLMYYRQNAYALEAKVNVDSSSATLTGSNISQSKTVAQLLSALKDKTIKGYSNYEDLGWGNWKGRKGCGHATDQVMLENDYEVTGFYIIVLENGQYLIDLLYQIMRMLEPYKNYDLENMTHDMIYGSTYGKLHKDYQLAVSLRAELMESSVVTTDGYGKISGLVNTGDNPDNSLNGGNKSSGQDYLSPAQGIWSQASDYSTYEESIAYLLDTYKGTNLRKGNAFNNVNSFFHYRSVDVFNMLRNGVNPNFFSSYQNANDLVFFHCILTEHHEGQNNTAVGWLSHYPWGADKGYDYYRASSITWAALYSRAAMSNQTTSDNTWAEADADSSTRNAVGFGQALSNYFGGIFNGAKKYEGTYNRLMRSSLALTDEELATCGYDSFTCVLNIDTSMNRRVTSRVLDWEQIPAGYILAQALFYAAMIAAAVFTGGTAGAAILALTFTIALIDGMVQMISPDNKSMFEYVVNMNF